MAEAASAEVVSTAAVAAATTNTRALSFRTVLNCLRDPVMQNDFFCHFERCPQDQHAKTKRAAASATALIKNLLFFNR